MSPVQVRYIFCDRRRPQAIEDVIPGWIARELGGKPPFTTEFFDDVRGAEARRRSTGSMALEQLKLRGVCGACNNGWMSRIESSVKPVLVDLIHGRPRLLTPADCRLVAAWCQLKCICLDARYGTGYEGIRHLPPEVAHAFGQTEQPLLSSSVAIGRFAAPDAGVTVRWGRLMSDVAGTAEHPPMRLVIVTLAIGSVVAKVVVGAWVPDRPALKATFSAAPDWALPCWPAELTVVHAWPPTTSITPGTFDRVASNDTNAHDFLPVRSSRPPSL